MDKESEQFTQTPRRWVFTRLALLAGGSALLLLASAFLLVDPWERLSPKGAAASMESGGQERQPDPLVAQDESLGAAQQFTKVEAGELYGGLFRIAVALLPTPTPAPTPTPTPQPRQEAPAAPQQAAPPASGPESPVPRPTSTVAPPPAPGFRLFAGGPLGALVAQGSGSERGIRRPGAAA